MAKLKKKLVICNLNFAREHVRKQLTPFWALLFWPLKLESIL